MHLPSFARRHLLGVSCFPGKYLKAYHKGESMLWTNTSDPGCSLQYRNWFPVVEHSAIGIGLWCSIPSFSTKVAANNIPPSCPLVISCSRKLSTFIKPCIANKSSFMPQNCTVCMCQMTVLGYGFQIRASTKRSEALLGLLLVAGIIHTAASCPYRGINIDPGIAGAQGQISRFMKTLGAKAKPEGKTLN